MGSICGAETKSGEPCQRSKNCPIHSNQSNSGLSTNNRTPFGTSASRERFVSQAGLSYDGDRDVYDVLGYPEDLEFRDYWDRYLRQNIARRIVDAAPSATWKDDPIIKSDNENLIEDVKNITTSVRAWPKLARGDKLSRIGEFGIAVLGTDDVSTDEDFEQELGVGVNLEYVSVFHNGHINDVDIDEDPTSERFGKPETYHVDFTRGDGDEDADGDVGIQEVHWSRVIHFADDVLDDEVYHVPALMPVFNLLIGLQHVVGGSQEAFWRMAERGLIFNLDPEATDIDTESMDTEIENYIHDWQRYMKLQGVETQELDGQQVDPSDVFDVIVQLISSSREDIPPKRILMGSERGELSSQQDEANWAATIRQRRDDYVGPRIVRQFVDRMIEHEMLPNVNSTDVEYEVEWPELFELNAVEKSEVASNRASAAKNISQARAAGSVLDDETAADILGVDLNNEEQQMNREMLEHEDQQIMNEQDDS